MRSCFCLILTLTALLFPRLAPAQQPPPTTLRIAAAADLRPALPDLSAAFTRTHPNITLAPTFAASGTLATQIISGAPFDLFLAADLSFPEKVRAANAALKDEQVFPYATGTLVLWTRTETKLDLSLPVATLLSSPKVNRIALANPATAPYGRAAVAVLTSLNLLDTLRPKLVYGENVAQTAQFAALGNADLALISLGQALSPTLAKSGHHIPLPPETYPPMIQGGLITAAAQDAAPARAFRDFLLSPAGQTVLQSHGFRPPPTVPATQPAAPTVTPRDAP